jgi:hypothetical protein
VARLHLVGDEQTAGHHEQPAGIPRRARDRLQFLRSRSPDAVAREAAFEEVANDIHLATGSRRRDRLHVLKGPQISRPAG